MQDLNVVLVQVDQKWEDKEFNLRHFEDILSDIKQSDLILFPEMFHTGFSMNVEILAETMDNSIGINWLKKIASEKNSAIYTSLIINENGKYFNRGVFVRPSGEIEIYDKRKSFGLAGEDQFFTAGNDQKVVEYLGWKIQLQICYDLRFPEISRNKIEASNQLPTYDVLVYVANWPEKRSLHWQTLLQARAIENQCYTIGVNRIGMDGKNLNYSGDSQISDALGDIKKTNQFQEQVLQYQLKMDDLKDIRNSFPFLKD